MRIQRQSRFFKEPKPGKNDLTKTSLKITFHARNHLTDVRSVCYQGDFANTELRVNFYLYTLQ